MEVKTWLPRAAMEGTSAGRAGRRAIWGFGFAGGVRCVILRGWMCLLFLGADVVDETKVMGSPLFLQLNAGEMKRKYASEKLEDTDDG